MQKDNHATLKNLQRTWLRLVVFVFLTASIGSAFALAGRASAQSDQAALLNQTRVAAGVGNFDLMQLIGRIINIFLGTLGIIFLVLLLYAGFIWMTAGDNPEKIKTAKGYIRNAVIGLIIIVSAWAITAFILNKLAETTGSGGITGKSAPYSFSLAGSSGSLGFGIIEYHLPEPNATEVPRNTPIIITFKYPIQPASFIDGWTADNGAVALNAKNIKIYPAGNEDAILTDATVNFTEDRKTFVIRPKVPPGLGSSTANMDYRVELVGGNSGILLEDGSPAFSGSFANGYEWGFQVSTSFDLKPPQILSIYPKQGLHYRNIVVQITFDEAVDPTGATGKVVKGAGFDNIKLQVGENAPLLDGEYRISNRYRTVEFMTFDSCGKNSCGKEIFCLPPTVTLNGIVEAATLAEADKPLAQFFKGSGFDGITDVVGNSLDGNRDGKANGKPDDTFDDWAFMTSGLVKTAAPKIVQTVPDAFPGGNNSYVPFDQAVTASFDDVLRSSTILTDTAFIVPKGPGETNPDTFWWFVGMNLLTEQNTLAGPDEEVKRAQIEIKHRPYLESPEGTSPHYYNPNLLHEIEDAYQNCFIPSGSKLDSSGTSCNATAALPFCCNSKPSASVCAFNP